MEAAFLLKNRLPGLKIRIAGEGPIRKRLEEKISDWGLEDVVELCGYVPDILAFYASLDVYVQPSKNEPFGLAALEAFRFGIPLVFTRGGFLPAMLDHGRWGILVDHSSDGPRRLAEAMETAWVEREAWAARAREGLAHWRSSLSVESMVGEYEAIFRAVLRGDGP